MKIQDKMAQYSRNLANRGNSVNKAGEVVNPSRAVINDFNKNFTTESMLASSRIKRGKKSTMFNDEKPLGILKNTITGIPAAAKKIGRKIESKVQKVKERYTKAFEEGEKRRPGVMKAKSMMGTGYRP